MNKHTWRRRRTTTPFCRFSLRSLLTLSTNTTPRPPVSWWTRAWWASWRTTSTWWTGWTSRTRTTAVCGRRPASFCSGRSAWPTTTRFPSRTRTADGWRCCRRTWRAWRRRRRRLLLPRRRPRRRWPTRTRRRCTRRTATANRWPPTVRAWTAACAGTSTPTVVPRVSRTPARCPTWTSGRRCGGARPAGNSLRWTSKSCP